MGRRAGVTAEQTRSTLLSAAADIFAAKGYDGASISDICTAASLTSGALYTHYSSKAELFVAVLEAHGQRQFQDLVSGAGDVASFLATAGAAYGRRQPDSSLMIEAIVASKRHPEVAQLVASWLDADEDLRHPRLQHPAGQRRDRRHEQLGEIEPDEERQRQPQYRKEHQGFEGTEHLNAVSSE